MNRTEAIAILHHHLDRLERLGYAALSRRIGDNEVLGERGETGADYQLELGIMWEHKPNGAILIIGSIDDGGLRAFFPLTGSRLLQPDTSPPPATP